MLLTGRGALLAMSGVFFLGLLGAGWLGWGWLAGGTFLAGSTAAARYTRRSDLLWVTASPPLLFGCALVLARVLTSGGSSAAAVAGGCLLLLAGVAPWLFAGVAASLVIAWLRGLPRCISEFRAGLRLPDAADGPGAGPGGGSRAAGASGRGQEMR